MARINVVKAFNLALPDRDAVIHFDPGFHEVGTYQRPVWRHELKDYDPRNDIDAKTGKSVTCEIAEHSWVKRHCGQMPSPEELEAEAAKLEQEAAAIRKQAKVEQEGSLADSVESLQAQTDADAKVDTGNGVKPNTRTKGNAEVKPNTKS